MYVLLSDETTEQLILWIKNYNDKTDNIVLLTPAARLTFLRRIVDKETQTIVSNVEAESYSDADDATLIEDQRIRAEINVECSTEHAIEVDFGYSVSAARKKTKITYIINRIQAIRILLKIFGSANGDEESDKINLNLTHGRIKLACIQQARRDRASTSTRVVTVNRICL
ncbi:hypothetical protein FRACYDRAFT_250043 [Fragilariopsis cylindrus CCMP1102]|uniref:Uncharacterized protein n=1 Tax=Fragilariopsis cylindrus CCMP1102 TaxID=635003 RepID=A0A1E7ER06_9STRA|nr:hypothetical protein FRACYDRAFT_250043 [Fragilariopsis cylindrus CCMP1102]|eukprot:OEU08257.1 hypothetical protein FRACYDRAFT_250043 [Fragilariopsis cylindrus CCMP1102]